MAIEKSRDDATLYILRAKLSFKLVSGDMIWHEAICRLLLKCTQFVISNQEKDDECIKNCLRDCEQGS